MGWIFHQLGLDLKGQVLEGRVRNLGFFGEFLLVIWRLTFAGMDDIQVGKEEKEGAGEDAEGGIPHTWRNRERGKQA